MKITFPCTNQGCGKPLEASPKRAGRAVKCPHCGVRVLIPSTPAAKDGEAGKSAGATPAVAQVAGPPGRPAPKQAAAFGLGMPFVYGGLSVGGLAAVTILFLAMWSLRHTVVKPADAGPPVPLSASLTPWTPPATSPRPVPALPEPVPTTVTARRPDGGAAPTLSTEEIVARSEHAVALVKGRFSQGTGFLVAKGILATNAHVISTELVDDLEVSFPSAAAAERGPFKAHLVYEDTRRDLAFLMVATNLEPLTMVKTGAPFRRGQDLVAIGNPDAEIADLQNAVSRGILSTELVIDRQRYYQIDMAINPGNSGGPVITPAGHVVGVATLKTRTKDGLAFCIPADEVQTALDSMGGQPKSRSAEVAALHRARVCCLYVSLVGKVYLLGMDAYAESARRAVANGASPTDAVKLVAKKIEPDLEMIRKRFVGDITPVLQEVAKDSHVPWSIRDHIAELWANYIAVRQHVTNPRGSVESYRMKAEELRARHEELMARLQISLGVETSP